MELKKLSTLSFIALWDSIANSKNFYDNEKGLFVAYIESIENIEYSYATPVNVFKFLNYSSNALDIR